jgi:tetratricopeptide (TPR) repeat protein
MRRTTAVLLSLLLAVPAMAAAQGADDEDGFAKAMELFRAGRFEASVPYFQRELDEAEARLGPDDPTVAVELNNLAEAYRSLGRLDEAEALYRRAVELDEKAGPSNAEGLATSLNNLALVHRAQGRLEEAERVNVRSLNLLEDALGPNHPNVARSLNNLAAVYRAQGKSDQARPLLERAVAIAESTLGPKHATTQQLRRNLANPGTSPPPKEDRPVAAATGAPPTPMPEPKPRSPEATVRQATAPPPLPDPLPEPAAPAAAGGRAAAAGGFAVQVAAVPERGQVAAEWQRLAVRFPLLHGLELQAPQSVEVAGKGTFYRVLAGPFGSRAEAEAVCERLRAVGGACRLGRL